MLAEMLLSAITPAGRTERRMGLVKASVGLWSRGSRRRRQWEPHHERCRATVRRAMAGLEQTRTVVVLGSGLARDIPLDELCATFRRVVLVDAVHLPTLRLAVAQRPNVMLVTRDLTGLADWLAGGGASRADPVADLAADPAVDLVVSANLLSQLPLGVEEFLERDAAAARRCPADLGDRTVGWHLDDLGRFRSRVCLITDVVMYERDRSGAVADELDLLRGHRLGPSAESWDWTVAPFGEIERAREFVHHVCAWPEWAPCRTGRPKPGDRAGSPAFPHD